MSAMSKGLKLERELSVKYHQKSALLISSVVLRDYGCGQIDISTIKNGSILLIEAKSHTRGVGYLQLNRLKKSAQLLSNLLEVNCQIIIEPRE